MKLTDWLVIGVICVLAVIPDPLDVLDFGLPIIESVSAVVYYIWRKDK